jgi:hypothetical protein
MYVKYSPEAVKQTMRKKDLSPRDIERRSNGKISYVTVYALLKGEYQKTQRAKVETLAKVLRVPVENLLKHDVSSN